MGTTSRWTCYCTSILGALTVGIVEESRNFDPSFPHRNPNVALSGLLHFGRKAVGWAVGGVCQSGWVGGGRKLPKRLGGRWEEVAKAVGGGYYRLQIPLKMALGVRETVAGHRLGFLPPCIPGCTTIEEISLGKNDSTSLTTSFARRLSALQRRPSAHQRPAFGVHGTASTVSMEPGRWPQTRVTEYQDACPL